MENGHLEYWVEGCLFGVQLNVVREFLLYVPCDTRATSKPYVFMQIYTFINTSNRYLFHPLSIVTSVLYSQYFSYFYILRVCF